MDGIDDDEHETTDPIFQIFDLSFYTGYFLVYQDYEHAFPQLWAQSYLASVDQSQRYSNSLLRKGHWDQTGRFLQKFDCLLSCFEAVLSQCGRYLMIVVPWLQMQKYNQN